jgi:hypothetical protein
MLLHATEALDYRPAPRAAADAASTSLVLIQPQDHYLVCYAMACHVSLRARLVLLCSFWA